MQSTNALDSSTLRSVAKYQEKMWQKKLEMGRTNGGEETGKKKKKSILIIVWQLQLNNPKLKLGIFVTHCMNDVCTLEPLKYLSREEMKWTATS